uniref:Uncharacterized protein n=1 Tax=Tanacetum cinerariifolium TaxID=118510 RepID=A0A6L2JT17_TANCI|nr:hypothetical protein [Tanacetum cinerariifolium]
MELCTKLSERVVTLETIKTNQAMEIDSLKRRVKRLEKKRRSRTHGIKRLYKVGLSARVESSIEEQSLGDEDASKHGKNIADIDANAETTLVNETAKDQGRFDDQEMFDTGVLDDEEVFVEKAVAVKEVNAAQDQVSAAITIIAKDLTVEDITLAKALKALKTSNPKIRGIVAKGIVMEEPSEATTTTILIPSNLQDKGKGIMVEPQIPLKKKAQISLDEALRLFIDFELAQRLQAEEQEQLTDAEKAKLFMEFLEKRRKFFAAKRAEEKRNRPPTKAQQRSLMCTYLKNMDGWKPRALKNKSFAEIKELFDRAMTRINYFVDFRTELTEESSKKAVQKEQEMSWSKKVLKRRSLQPLLTKRSTKKEEKVISKSSGKMMVLRYNVWKNQQGLAKVKNWKLFYSCRDRCVSMQNTTYYLFVEKMYTFINCTLTQMWNDVRLQVDYEVEMAYDLLRLVKRRLREGYVPKWSV